MNDLTQLRDYALDLAPQPPSLDRLQERARRNKRRRHFSSGVAMCVVVAVAVIAVSVRSNSSSRVSVVTDSATSTLTAREIPVPNVVGLSLQGARRTLGAANDFNACWTYAYATGMHDGTVIGQSPPAHTVSPRRARVDVTVAAAHYVPQTRAFDCANGRPHSAREVFGTPPTTETVPASLPPGPRSAGPAPSTLVQTILHALPRGYTVTRANITAFGSIRFPDMSFTDTLGNVFSITIQSNLDLRSDPVLWGPFEYYYDTAIANVWTPARLGRREPRAAGVIAGLPGDRVAWLSSSPKGTERLGPRYQPLTITTLETVASRLIADFTPHPRPESTTTATAAPDCTGSVPPRLRPSGSPAPAITAAVVSAVPNGYKLERSTHDNVGSQAVFDDFGFGDGHGRAIGVTLNDLAVSCSTLDRIASSQSMMATTTPGIWLQAPHKMGSRPSDQTALVGIEGNRYVLISAGIIPGKIGTGKPPSAYTFPSGNDFVAIAARMQSALAKTTGI